MAGVNIRLWQQINSFHLFAWCRDIGLNERRSPSWRARSSFQTLWRTKQSVQSPNLDFIALRIRDSGERYPCGRQRIADLVIMFEVEWNMFWSVKIPNAKRRKQSKLVTIDIQHQHEYTIEANDRPKSWKQSLIAFWWGIKKTFNIIVWLWCYIRIEWCFSKTEIKQWKSTE
jgi:hypothetical protein